jgi:hypothetical protein
MISDDLFEPLDRFRIAGLALNPAYTIARDRALWTWVSNDPKFLDQLDLFFDGLRRAGAPE